jgi:hypothetical protein
LWHAEFIGKELESKFLDVTDASVEVGTTLKSKIAIRKLHVNYFFITINKWFSKYDV